MMSMRRSLVAIGILLAVSEALYLFLYAPGAQTPRMFLAVALVNSGLYVLAWLLLVREDVASSRGLILLVVLFGVLARVSLISLEPVVSDDIYRYIWDGKVQSHGIDPYRYAPDDPALSHLHSAMLPGKVNHPGMRTIYPPLAEWLFCATYSVTGESVAGFKVPLLLSEIATIILLLLVLKELKLPAKYVALYALSPLPVMQFMIDGHIDAFAFPFLLLFLLLYRKRRLVPAFLCLGLSVIVKLYPLFLLPLVVKDERGRNRWFAALLVAAVLAAAYLPYLILRSFPLESLGIYSQHWSANGSVFSLIYLFLNNNQTAHIVSGLLTCAWVIGVIFVRGSFEERAFLTLFGMFLLSPTVHPWYITWLAVLLPVAFRWSGLVFVALVNVSIVSVIYYTTSGIWDQPLWMFIAEYLPVYLLILAESRKKGAHARNEPVTSPWNERTRT